MSFTVKVEPRKVREHDPEAPDDPQMDSFRTVYDIHVYDGDGEEHEQQLVFSHQGYENRGFAEWLAIRLFASAEVIATELGVNPPQSRTSEIAVLRVYNADGEQVRRLDLR